MLAIHKQTNAIRFLLDEEPRISQNQRQNIGRKLCGLGGGERVEFQFARCKESPIDGGDDYTAMSMN